MARCIPSSTAFLLCLIFLLSVSSARVPVDLPGVDETNHVSVSKSDADPVNAADTILLPIDKPESESASMIQWEPQTETSDSKISDHKPETLESIQVPTQSSFKSDSDRVPLTLIRFHPINRHDIPRRPMPFSFRLGGHRCRHNHKLKPWDPRLPRREISYGNDMILSKFEDNGVASQIPTRWTRFHRVAPRFSQEHMMERSEETDRPHPHPHHHHHHHDQEHDESAFMKGIRKFLNHF